ncbi:MAG TPA: RluA family pseudouridine synthase [Spirochaetota bacterium]|mgnify:CR=1 FL=1|nr:RluA family pseudouridine synthase [Spirochaetota bacterium]
MIKRISFKIEEENFINKRLDKVITEYNKEFSRSFLKKYLKNLKVNNKTEKLSHICKINDFIELEIEYNEEPEDIEKEYIPLDIIYEDENYIVINKKSGMVTHPAKGNWKGTIVNALLYLNKTLSDKDRYRPGIVHRLDKETSGLLLIAKNNISHEYLTTLFQKREIVKKYHAIVKGNFTKTNLIIKNRIGRDRENRKKMAVLNDGRGKESITIVHLIKNIKNYSYLDIELKTGRTHQIRVHLSYIGYPILGDKIYGRKSREYSDIPLCLNAYYLAFFDKFSNKNLAFEIKDPYFFNEILGE